MYYNNYPFLRQLQGEGPLLNRTLQTQKSLIGAVAILSVACVVITLQYQRQRTLITELQRQPRAMQ